MAGIDISDLNSLAADLTRAGARARTRANEVVRKTAADIEANAKTIAPVDTGNLRNSIGSDITGNANGGTAIEAVIGPTTAYGRYLEYGTSRMGPHAFMGPSLDRFSGAFEAAMAQIGDAL